MINSHRAFQPPPLASQMPLPTDALTYQIPPPTQTCQPSGHPQSQPCLAHHERLQEHGLSVPPASAITPSPGSALGSLPLKPRPKGSRLSQDEELWLVRVAVDCARLGQRQLPKRQFDRIVRCQFLAIAGRTWSNANRKLTQLEHKWRPILDGVGRASEPLMEEAMWFWILYMDDERRIGNVTIESCAAHGVPSWLQGARLEEQSREPGRRHRQDARHQRKIGCRKAVDDSDSEDTVASEDSDVSISRSGDSHLESIVERWRPPSLCDGISLINDHRLSDEEELLLVNIALSHLRRGEIKWMEGGFSDEVAFDFEPAIGRHSCFVGSRLASLESKWRRYFYKEDTKQAMAQLLALIDERRGEVRAQFAGPSPEMEDGAMRHQAKVDIPESFPWPRFREVPDHPTAILGERCRTGERPRGYEGKVTPTEATQMRVVGKDPRIPL